MLWLLVSPHVPNLLSNEPNPGWSPATDVYGAGGGRSTVVSYESSRRRRSPKPTWVVAGFSGGIG